MSSYASVPSLDHDAGETVLTPPSDGPGNWIGAPFVHHFEGDRLLAVRERTPEERGHTVRLYREDGDLERLCSIPAESLGVVSVERPALATDPHTGKLITFLPVDYGSNQWRIQRLEGVSDPTALDPSTATDVLAPRAGTSDAVTVKDPYVLTVSGQYYMFYAGHDGLSEQAHLATSVDGRDWTRAPTNPVLERQYWHDHHTRVSCVVPAPDAPVWQVFYEGSSKLDHGETWNLRTGIAVSHDLTSVVDTTTRGPRYAAPHATTDSGVDEFATMRYLDVSHGTDTWTAYYEVAREDGTFELRRAPLTYE